MGKHVSQPARPLPSTEAARALLLRVREVGGDPGAIMGRSGLANAETRSGTLSLRTRLTLEQFVAIYRESVLILDRHARINTGLEPLSRAEFEMLCHCMMTCSTLAEVIERCAAFSAMIQHRAGVLTLQVIGERVHFRLGPLRAKHDVSAFLADITGLVAYARLFGWLIAEDIEPLNIEVLYKNSLEDELISQLVPYQIRYEAPHDALIFPKRYLGYPVVRAPSELRDFLKSLPFDPAARQSGQAPMSERVRAIFNAGLAQRKAPATTAELAAQFRIGTATLKRRLADEGTSVKAIKERCRHETALALLADERLALSEIAARVGLSNATAFSRAFRAWQGQSPSDYRRSCKSRS